ncbi:MAG TPA: hypothetical protein VKT77_04225 [Chthonomonadaceae bacterium]|nr:hypothetical protein [Chthonomonadaceae bacterium]
MNWIGRSGLLCAATLFGIVLGSAARANPGPPYFTDDPEPVEYRHWEVYAASQYSNGRDGVFYTAPHVEINYGAAPNLQLHVIAPFAYSRPGGGMPAQYGFGDTELGVKYRFVQETKQRPQIGVFPLLEAPTGDAGRGLGNGQAQVFLPVWLQKSWGKWSSYGGAGYWINPGAGNRNYWFTGIQVQRMVSKQLALGAELFHATSNAVWAPDRTGFNIGAVYDFDEGHHLLLSGGTDFHGPTRGAAYVAYQWTFGPHEAHK